MDHDTQEGILSFPFDHLYACHTENVDNPGDNLLRNIENEQAQNEILQLTNKFNNAQKEICRLKDLTLIHLDLIQQQSDELIQKDKEIQSYQQEIEKLKASTSQNENTLNFRLQNINPPPLIHLAPVQVTSTVTLLPETSSQVQIANLASLISPSTSVDSLIGKKKPDITDTFTCYSAVTNKDNIPFTSVGTLIDTRYIQCADNSFDGQQNICLQPVVQSTIQPTITSVQSYIQPDSITNISQFETIPIQISKSSHSQVVGTLDDKKITREFHLQKEMGSKLSDNNLTLNKKCKTIFTYEKKSKKNVKKGTKNPVVIQQHDTLNKSSKTRDLVQKSYVSNTTDKSMINLSCLSPPGTKSKISGGKYSYIDNKLVPKIEPTQKLAENNTNEKLGEIKVIKQEKLMQPRKFFTSGIKEKASCRDFSYGENFGNMKFIKSNILEYLEGPPANTQSGMELIDTNVNNQEKLNNYLSKFLNSASPTSNNLINLSENALLEDQNILEIKNEVKEEVEETIENEPIEEIEKIDLYEFQSSEEFDSNNQMGCNLVFMGNFVTEDGSIANCDKSTKKRSFRTTSMCMTNQESLNTSQQLATYKSVSNSRKRNVRRKRALSSASKVSNISQGDSPMPYSWSFSGQDFKILTEDIKSSYFIANFGSNNSYFSLEHISQQQAELNPPDNTSLEVPRWRIKCYSPDEYAKSNEVMDEELFLKRHSKMEIEEKRRKRWDFQMIREQRHIEKLKQRQERRNSGGFKHNRNSKLSGSGLPEELPSSLYPSPDDIFSIEITDSLPVSAFGECIPDLPPRPFSLPWVRNSSHSRVRLHSSGKKKLKSEKSEEE